MSKILVLDRFTNGHEAALTFIKNLNLTAIEIVFCGSHERIIKQLSEGPALAVLPVRNSIVGEISEVTSLLLTMKEMGYEFEEISKASLRIEHCLMAKSSIKPEEMELVLSHKKALEQCNKFLNNLSTKRAERDSTGGAAKAVSRMSADSKTAAIAPKAAALAYDLKIIAENIGNSADNETEFVLIQNRAIVEKMKVGIIGINGKFGQVLKNFFEKLGSNVTGSDIGTEKTNEEVVKDSDVVIFSVPIKSASEIIRSVVPFSKEDQLWIDITSIKQKTVRAMLESKAQVLGIHPMFRPDVTFVGQTIVACPARLDHEKWKKWSANMLSATGSKIKWSASEAHDANMAAVQVIPHLSNLTSALLMAEIDVSTEESLEFTSPFYKVMFSLIGRLVSQGHDLYASIILENPKSALILEKRIKLEQEMLKLVKNNDQAGFEALFEKANKYLGPKVVKDADDLFKRLLSVLTTLHGKNSVTLEFSKTQSQPGLLEKVCGVFSRRKINLTGINSVAFDGRIQFTISFEKPRYAEEVKQALEEIEDWPDHTVIVLD